MVAEFESLDASSRAMLVDDVFTFVPVLALRRRESLALAWKEGIKLAVPPTFYDNSSSTRLWGQVNASARICFVGDFSAKLKMTPDRRVSCCTAEMFTQLARQFVLS